MIKKIRVLALLVPALVAVATKSYAGGSFGDRSRRFPRPDIDAIVDRMNSRTNRDDRLNVPGHGHWSGDPRPRAWSRETHSKG